MRLHFTIFLLVASIGWGWLQTTIFPKPMLLLCLGIAMVTNLITGIAKAIFKGELATLVGVSKTGFKIVLYAAVLMGSWLLATLASLMGKFDVDYSQVLNVATSLLCLREIKSVFLNAEVLDNGGDISKYLIRPVLSVLEGKLLNSIPFKFNKKESDEK